MSRDKRPKHKCINCGKRLLSHYVDVEVASGWIVMRQMRELYCPDSHEYRLAPESQRLVDAIAAVVRLAPQPMLLAAYRKSEKGQGQKGATPLRQSAPAYYQQVIMH